MPCVRKDGKEGYLREKNGGKTLVRCWGGYGRLWGVLTILVVGACGVRSNIADRYPDVAEHAGRLVDDVRFTGTEPFGADTLLTLIQTQPSRCSFLGLPFCVPFTRIGREEHRLSPGRIESDIETLERFYRVAGYFGTRVEPSIQSEDEDVDVTFAIRRGDPVVLDRLEVSGTEPVIDPDTLAQRLPLRMGDIFHLGRFIQSSDAVVRRLQNEGHAYAEVLRSFTVDTIDNRAEATLDALPGPQVTIDSIIVRGAPNLGRKDVLRQVEVTPGELLIRRELSASQRNLYALELVSLASVTIAPDSLQAVPADSTTATLIVSISEAAVHEVEAAVGFGTKDCLRSDVQWVSRSFGGGARRLALRGSVSRLGVGEPFAIGAGERVCPTEPRDSIFGGSRFDYRLAADFTQPYFLNPRNQIGVNAYSERTSEPGVFTRQATGGRAGVSRRLGTRSGVAVALEAERGHTRASAALFCAAFLVCEPATIDSIARPRFRSDLAASYFHDRTNNALDPTRGFVARTAMALAPPWLGSEIRFFRWTGEGSLYTEIRPRNIAAFSLRVGNFFRTITIDPREGNFLPPEERFYAGGASSVRGFDRNGLGPGVYVTDSDSIEVDADGDTAFAREPQFVPTGGTAVIVTSAELRLPSPFLSDILRLAVFVDGGAVGTRSLWDINFGDWRFTPGAGVRLQTPVGPVRVDLAVNPYPRPAAPVLVTDVETGRVRRVMDEYRPSSGNIFSRLRLHLGVGHAF